MLHSSAPGERAKVIYWYRTAPGLRLGRPALDDGAMRTLEEQYPDIDFDWPYLLDMASMTPVEVEAPVPVRKRKPRRDDLDDGAAEPAPARPARAGSVEAEAAPSPDAVPETASAADEGVDLLDELLGRGIASSLRARHAELAEHVESSPADPALKAAWRTRLAAIDPDGWTTPELVMAGIASVETDADALQESVDAASGI
ncbi:MAG TPA: hypothetical protein VMW48_13575 [Vicinamibacterales bacterium]|nr:hypothetical protein [Vicinamibacterales bacterium]